MPVYEIEDTNTGATFEVEAPTQTAAWNAYKGMLSAEPTAFGGPMEERLAVGAAQSQEDRLATIRRFHPDAMPYGDDNFAYLDNTGQKRLHNKPGADWGDIAEYAPEIAEIAGSTVGAIGGGLAGTVLGPAGTAGGAIAGAGFGGATAKHLLGLGQQQLGATVDTRSALDIAGDQARDFAFNAAGEGIGRGVVDLASRAVQRAMVSPGAKARIDELSSLGVDPRGAAGEVADTHFTRGLSSMLNTYPSSMNTMGRARDATLDSYGSAVMRNADGATPESANEALRLGSEIAANQAKDRILGNLDALKTATRDVSLEADDLVNVRALQGQFAQRAGAAPGMTQALVPATREMDRMLSGGFGEGVPIPYHEGMLAKTRLFDVAHPQTDATGMMKTDARQVNTVYDALRDDLRATLGNKMPGALPLLDAHNDAVIGLRAAPGATGKTNQQLLDVMANKDTDALAAWAMSGSNKGSARLQQLQALMPPAQWGDFAQSVLAKWGHHAATGDFSVSQFVTRWNTASDEAKRLLFGKDYERLSRLAKAGESIKQTDEYRNRSQTGLHSAFQSAFNNVGTGLAAAGTGTAALAGGLPVAAMTAASLAGPWSVARGLTSPNYLDWAIHGGVSPTTEAAGGLLGRSVMTNYGAGQ